MCSSVACVADGCRRLLPAIRRALGVVVRWRLWRGSRKRPRVLRVWWRGVRFDFRYDLRHGFCLVAAAVIRVRGGVRSAVVLWEFDVPKKPVPGATQGGAAVAPAKRSKVLGSHPLLASFLMDLSYEDSGDPREPSYLLIKVRGSVWEVTLKDPTECRQLVVQVPSDDLAYAALEALLGADVCPWQPDSFALARAKGKKR